MADTKNNEHFEKIDDHDLSKVTGGSIGNVEYTETDDISDDTKKKA